ncbi:hypothetical protein LshimejAT787_0301420 [Lyophyllum shimeji]|uniref:Uncharacterized protein n=1 Tax=Lyophyllum shimeji TaxID=47721 RepID=A0A9P3PI31_LYOSH|nr:hypothetical protein LshimejAT787_0301420 [Lyophyllum shimeji]
MPTRCRNFNDDGTAGWASAHSYDHSSTRGRGAYRGRGGRAGSGSWTDQRASELDITTPRAPFNSRSTSKDLSTSSSIQWDQTSWGIPKRTAQTESSTSSARTGGTGDKSVWGSPIAATSKGDGVAWGAWGKETASVWGSGDTTVGAKSNKGDDGGWGGGGGGGSGWGSGSGNGWGSGSGNGWGSGSGNGWGSGDIASNGWGTTESGAGSSGWEGIGGGGWDMDTSKSKGKRVDEAERGAGWTTGWVTGTSEWDAKPPPSPQVQPPAAPPPRATEITKQPSRSVTPISATIQAADKPRPLPPPGQKSTTPADASKGTKTGPSLKIRTQSIPAPEPVLTGLSGSVRTIETSLSGAHVYSNTIKYTQHAVRLQLELDVAQANVERWKRTQSSTQYTRATPATRRRLDAQRAVYAQEVVELKKRLDATIKYLAEQPDFSAKPKLSFTEINEQELMAYTTGLRDWIRNLRLSEYLAPREPPSPPPTGKEDRPQDPKEVIWDKILSSAKSMDELSDRISESLYTRRSRGVDSNDLSAKLREARDAKQRDALASTEASVQKLRDEANQVGNDLGEIAEYTANLLEKDHEQGQVLAQLKAELERIETARVQMQGYLEQLERWKVEDAATIEDLRARLQTLYKVERPPRPSLTVDDFLPAIRTLVVSDLQRDIATLVVRIKEACSQSSAACIDEISKQVQPILDTTNAVCRRADALTSGRLLA